MPSLVFYKCVIHSKVHGHWLSADRTTGKHVGWYAEITGTLHHTLNGLLVSVHFSMAWDRASVHRYRFSLQRILYRRFGEGINRTLTAYELENGHQVVVYCIHLA